MILKENEFDVVACTGRDAAGKHSDIQSYLFTIYCGSECHSSEQTVQLREKNSHLVPLSLWQCLDYKSGDSI